MTNDENELLENFVVITNFRIVDGISILGVSVKVLDLANNETEIKNNITNVNSQETMYLILNYNIEVFKVHKNSRVVNDFGNLVVVFIEKKLVDFKI